jgi:hypothetical protein
MSYFIFTKDLENIPGSIYRIAENQNDLNNSNINKSDYRIIEDSQENFNAVKYGIKHPQGYNGNTIIYLDQDITFKDKEDLKNYVNLTRNFILPFLENNSSHPYFNIWNNYYTQLNNLNLNNITYPLNKSLEQYFNDLGQPSLNPLQLP